jgi:hypothetical protein
VAQGPEIFPIQVREIEWGICCEGGRFLPKEWFGQETPLFDFGKAFETA